MRTLERGLRQVQGLALSRQMRLSLDLLAMDRGRLGRWLRLQGARNPALAPLETPQSVSERQELAARIGLLRLSPEEARVAGELVHCLDDRGWLSDPMEEIARWLETSPAVLEALLPRLQELEPAGVFARGLAEQFRLQLQARGRFDPMIARLLDRLDLAASGDLAAVAALCGCDREDAAEMLADLRALPPHPFTGEAPPPVPPELEIAPDGAVRSLPGTGLALGDGGGGEGARAILEALGNRARTLERIGAALAAAQSGWLRGEAGLRPLTMTALAERLGLHKSTVSRALAGTAARTPRGVVALADLLPRPVSARNPGLRAEDAAKTLAELLGTWPSAERYSDARMSEKLAERGVLLSRRTVAKYRLALARDGEPR